MNQKNPNQRSHNLHQTFRMQIVQNYPPSEQYYKSIFLEEQLHEQSQQKLRDQLLCENQIVEDYMHLEDQPKRRSIMNFDNLMASESDNNQVPSRNSSLSSQGSNLDLQNRSFEQIPNLIRRFKDDMMDIQENKNSIIKLDLAEEHIQLDAPYRERQKTSKINKIQQVGCNCRKSKCLKMYCQCFHLQIFCSENCNCVECGNTSPNQGHQQAVIDALTRNPKAFQQQNPGTQNGFTLGVQLAEVKKGCKCKKTKCLKKYCQCYNSGAKCGLFCKCQSCQNS